MRPTEQAGVPGGAGWGRKGPEVVANRRLWGEGLRARARRAGQLRRAALTSPVGWIPPSTGSRGAPQALGNGAVEVVHQRPPREKVTILESRLGEGL